MSDADSHQLPLEQEELEGLRRLLDFLDSSVPERYRVPLFNHLLPRLAPRERPSSAAGPESVAHSPAVRLEALTLAPYRDLLQRRGDNLTKALVVLEAAEAQLGTSWLTPRTVADLLEDRAGLSTVYRSNVSNALRTAEGVVERREEGRGYSYRITRQGRDHLRRELRLTRLD